MTVRALQMTRLAICAAPIALLFATGTARGAEQQREPGELWETTSQISMSGPGGMKIPDQTQQICRPKSATWNEPPGVPKDSECQVRDFTATSSRATWSMTCKGGMSGTGEMTFEAASYAGKMTIKSPQGDMAINMKGRRLGGDCDASEGKRTAERMQAQARDSQAQANAYVQQGQQAQAAMCTEGAKKGMTPYFLGTSAVCNGPQNKAAFCAGLGTAEGYAGASSLNKLQDAATFCGKQSAAVLADACTSASATGAFDFLAKQCPDQAKALAQRECAGRKYTAIADARTRDFCTSYAQTLLGADAQPAADQAKDQKDSTADKAKRGVKGLIRR